MPYPQTEKIPAVVRQLADNMMRLLNIAEGQQLMYLIGSGHERDKCEAVRHWVQQAVADLAPEQGYPLLADLMMKLEKELLGKGVGTRH